MGKLKHEKYLFKTENETLMFVKGYWQITKIPAALKARYWITHLCKATRERRTHDGWVPPARDYGTNGTNCHQCGASIPNVILCTYDLLEEGKDND